MTYAGTMPSIKLSESACSNCSQSLELASKFCGSCGFIVAPATFSIQQLSGHHDLLHENFQHATPQGMPGFATSGIPVDNPRSKQMIEEANKLTFLLARERLFLYSHWLVFIIVNVFGFWVAWKCYFDFVGDEMSKMMVASTPFLFINSLALMSLVPIKGTRAEIAKLKERLSYTRFNIESEHIHW